MRNKCAHIQGKATASQWSDGVQQEDCDKGPASSTTRLYGLSYNNIKTNQVPVSLLAKRPLACNLPFAERELVCFPGVVKRSDPPSATSTDKGQGHSPNRPVALYSVELQAPSSRPSRSCSHTLPNISCSQST